MKSGNEGVKMMRLMKLRIATGLGLLLFMADMFGGPIRVSQAQDDQGGVTLASLAGKFAARGGGFSTVCFNAGALISCSSVSATPVPFNFIKVSHTTRDADGNSCEVSTSTSVPVFGTKLTTLVFTVTKVGTSTFDPTTGQGTTSFNEYHGGSCIGAAGDLTGATLTTKTSDIFIVSDSGNRFESIATSFTPVTSAFSVPGSIKGVAFSATYIRQ